MSEDLDSWADFMDVWVKVDHFKEMPGKMHIVRAKAEVDDDGKAVLKCDVQVNEGKYKWQPNKTAMKKFLELKLGPKDIVGKNIIVEKCKVFNPQLKAQVDSFEVVGVE